MMLAPISAPSLHARHPRGHTLVEMMIALIILGTGLLALAGSAAGVIRLVAGGGRGTFLATSTQNLLDSLRARPCDQLRDGVDSSAMHVARWSVSRGLVTQQVALTVISTGRGASRPLVVTTGRPCRGL